MLADLAPVLGVATKVLGVPLGVLPLIALLGVPLLEVGDSLGSDMGESLGLAIIESLRSPFGVSGVVITHLAKNFLETEMGVRHCSDFDCIKGVPDKGVENLSILPHVAGVFRMEGVFRTDDWGVE